MASIRLIARKDGATTYQVLYRLDGRQTSLPFTDPASAEVFRTACNELGPAKALALHGIDPGPVRNVGGTTVAQYLRSHIDALTGVEKKTVAEYRRYLDQDIKPVIGHIPLAGLTPKHVATWVQAMAERRTKSGRPVAGKTVANKHGFLSGALNVAARRGLITTNPCEGVRLPRTERGDMLFLTRDEFAQLLTGVTAHYKPFVQFLAASGARFGEATALRPTDVNHETGTVRIQRAWKKTDDGWELGAPKTRRSVRTINIPPTVLDQLDCTREWLFTSTRGTPIRSYGWRENVWYPSVTRSGIVKRPRIHDLRHTCASWMIQAGIPLPVIQQHLGHESITTTVNTYGHLDRTSAQAAADVMQRMLTDRDQK